MVALLAQQLNRPAGAGPLGTRMQSVILTKCSVGCIAGSAAGFRLLADMFKRGRQPGKAFFHVLIKALCVEGRVCNARGVFDGMPHLGCLPDSTSYSVLVEGFCMAGHTSMALAVVREMMVQWSCSGRDAITCSTVVKCLCNEGFLDDALVLMREMNAVGMYPSVTAYDTLVRALCGMGNAIMALELVKEAVMHVSCRRFGVATYNLVIDGLLKDGYIYDALWLVEKLNVAGNPPDTLTCNIVIKGLSKNGNSTVALKLFEKMVMQEGHCKPDVVTCCAITDGLCEEGLFDDALRAIQDMKAVGISLDIMVYHTLIKHLCKMGNTKLAIDLVKEMTWQGNCSTPGVSIYNMIVKKLCEEGFVKDALMLIGDMKDAKVSPNIVTYNNLVMGLCEAGNMSMAIELLKEMSMSGSSCKPDVFSYSMIINELCNEGSVIDALNLVKEMTVVGISPNNVTFAALLKGLCRIKNTHVALKFLREVVVHSSYKPDVIMYTTLVDGFCNEGLINDALELIHEMNVVGIFPNVVTYNSLVKGLCRTGNTKVALMLVEDMSMEGNYYKPDVVTYSTIIDRLCKEGSLNGALRLVTEMKQVGIFPNVITCGSLVNGLCRMHDIDMVLKLLKEMEAQADCCKPDIVIYTTIVAWFCKKGYVYDGLRLVREVNFKGISLNVVTYNTLIKGLFRMGDTTAAIKLLREMMMQGKSCKPNFFTYVILIDGICKHGSVDDALSIFGEMKEKGFSPSPNTIAMLLDLIKNAEEYSDYVKLFHDVFST
ncbi:hypothetical protein Taro_025235 [Colocasia esculenta]|uniref:Pentatricopeptide repeat-containing protein n=1 Tax=Colocasia esculenta TaxID=4460 RepID=A0A843VMT4_COLES|nr:hypothetical protein [Colocasia esculenta]